MLAPTVLTKRGDKTNTSSVGYADGSLRQKKLAAFHIRSLLLPFRLNPAPLGFETMFWGGGPLSPVCALGSSPREGAKGERW